ncbi:MAG: hypothetical protein GQ574_13145 [Crocinitomix sp.]|nr:hypothetical protein [Crocinitomix sp.]
MDNIFKKFYRETYHKTGGYFSVIPNSGNVYPGDFFQIRNGQLIFLGNIFNPTIINASEVDFENNISLNPSNWNFQQGCSKPYSGRGTGQNAVEGEFEFSKQVLAFDDSGSFIFKGNDPKAFRIANWSQIQDELIIKLTQTYYSFRELYLVTECVTLKDWTLAIAGKEEAELEIATESENFGLVDIFGESSSKTIQSKDMAYYHQEMARKSEFFKAKKLVVQEGKVEIFISDMIKRQESHQQWANDFYDQPLDSQVSHFSNAGMYNARASLLDLLQGNQLNPNTALEYFKWVNADLDDLERFFEVYGGK